MITVCLIPAIIGNYLKGNKKMILFIISLLISGYVIFSICLSNIPLLLLALIAELCIIATLLTTFWVKSGDQRI